MAEPRKNERDHIAETRAALIAAILPHVPFDGWSAEAFSRAVSDSEVDAGLAHLAAPRGALDLALAYHRSKDGEMVAQLCGRDLSGLRFRDRIALAVRLRLEAIEADKEAVRRAVTLFALPQHAGEGSRALWTTVDRIWDSLGDTSEDVNWYTKRATLSGVYSATLLYWLGDTSEGHEETWGFLDRRIENVMQFESAKARLRDTGLGRALEMLTGRVRKPDTSAAENLPGRLG